MLGHFTVIGKISDTKAWIDYGDINRGPHPTIAGVPGSVTGLASFAAAFVLVYLRLFYPERD